MTMSAPAPRGSLPLGILLGVIVGAVAVLLAWFALVDDPDTATPAPSPTPTATAPQEPTPEASPEATPAEEPTPTPSPTPTPEPTPEVSPEPTAAPNPLIVTDLPRGSFVTVLASLPKGSTTEDQAIARAQQESRAGHSAIVVDSDAVGLTPGYYAIVIPGSASREAATAVCQAIGMGVSDRCYPREIQG